MAAGGGGELAALSEINTSLQFVHADLNVLNRHMENMFEVGVGLFLLVMIAVVISLVRLSVQQDMRKAIDSVDLSANTGAQALRVIMTEIQDANIESSKLRHLLEEVCTEVRIRQA